MPSSLPPDHSGPLLFDLDGTLTDTLADIGASVNHLRAVAGGLPPLDREGVKQIVGDGASALCERALAGSSAGLSADEAMEIYRSHHLEQCTREVTAYPGVLDALQRYRAAGRPLAVVTNKPARFASRVLDHLDLTPYFGTLIGGDSTDAKKPSPTPLFAALEQLGARAADAVMIGDGQQDIQAGKAAGCATVGVLYGFRDRATVLAEKPDLLWSAFDVLAT